MTNYYTALTSRTHAFILERRLKNESVPCELTYMPREIMIDVCNLGVRFREDHLREAMAVIRQSGLPGCRVYREELFPDGSKYIEV